MNRPLHRIAVVTLAAAALAVGGCTTGPGRSGPVDVTRYHLGSPIAQGSVATEPMASTDMVSPEYRTYASAVSAELARMGYAAAPSGSPSDYIAGVSFARAARGTLQQRSPVSVGVGGGTGGIGGGLSFGIGGGPRDVIVSELWVQLRRRGDNTVVWEGRAQTDALEGSDGAQPIVSAERLAKALFKGFPGESGVTITVP